MSRAAVLRELVLRSSIYKKTAAYSRFGRHEQGLGLRADTLPLFHGRDG